MAQTVGSLSGGWARRLDVVLACIGRPYALVLDESTSGIDPVARAELWEFLRRRRGEGVAVRIRHYVYLPGPDRTPCREW